VFLLGAVAAKGDTTMALRLTSPAFASGEDIPIAFTCEGKDVSPPLAWSDVPAAAKSFALIADDPDAPDPKAPKRTWVHWVLYNLPATARALPENAHGALPEGALEGLNDWGQPGWRGPCPPIGKHRYVFKLYALDTVLGALPSATKPNLEKAIEGHIVGKTELVARYEKKHK
jgi:Raf kinase inhibitor-like YbhB/YbcL family protein